MEKMILTDYRTVAELIKAFHGVQVTRKGDGYSGVYYEVQINGSPRKIKGNGSKTDSGRGRRKSKRQP